MRRFLFALAAIAFLQVASADTAIELLKHPWPYQASVTVSSDRHRTPPAVADAVHSLVMTEDTIGPESDVRRLVLGAGAGATLQRGFGLPLADSFWLVGEDYSVFRRVATSGAELQLNTEFSEHVDSLFKQGRLDTLHTFGTGEISRAQAKQALDWLREQPYRRPSVWVSHSFSETPSGSEPGVMFLNLAVKNMVKGGLRWMGDLSLTTAVAERVPPVSSIQSKLRRVPKPYPYPAEARWTVAAFYAVVAGIALGSLGLIKGGWGRRVRYAVQWTVLSALALAVFLPVQLNYSTGDNPESSRYNIDLVNKFGMNFHWFIMPRPGYQPLIANSLALKEQDLAGRRTVFNKVRLDNGDDVVAFSRNTMGFNGMRSLELLTEERLASLQASQGISVLYTHWFEQLPGGAFTDAALDGMGRLRDAWKSGQIWVAPSGKMLDFHFVRAFLNFETEESEGVVRVDIHGIDSPIDGKIPVSRIRLSGLSFAGPDASIEIQVWHNDYQLQLEKHALPDGNAVWQIL